MTLVIFDDQSICNRLFLARQFHSDVGIVIHGAYVALVRDQYLRERVMFLLNYIHKYELHTSFTSDKLLDMPNITLIDKIKLIVKGATDINCYILVSYRDHKFVLRPHFGGPFILQCDTAYNNYGQTFQLLYMFVDLGIKFWFSSGNPVFP